MHRSVTGSSVRSSRGRRGDAARAPGARPAAGGDLLACHDVGRPGRPARQPHAQPGRGAVRRRGLRDARPASAGPAARAPRPRGARQRIGLALPGAQPPAGTRAAGGQARCGRCATSTPRRATRPTKGSQVRRVEQKRHRAQTKRTAARPGARRRLRPGQAAQPLKANADSEAPRPWSSWASSPGSSSARGPRSAVERGIALGDQRCVLGPRRRPGRDRSSGGTENRRSGRSRPSPRARPP